MNRRNFIKYTSLSLITSQLLIKENLLAQTFDSNGKQIIQLFCSGGADFRYLFAPFEDNEYKSLYFEKQQDIIQIEDYEKISLNNENILIRKDANSIKKHLLNDELAVISNVWFSPNRDHNYSIQKALLGINEKINPFNQTNSSWLGKISALSNKNIIQNSTRYPYATQINKEEFNNDSQSISCIKSRPFGISSNDNVVHKALKRFYNSY